MFWQKILNFNEVPRLFSREGFKDHLDKIDAARSVDNRLDQTTSSEILVENEAGLKIFLEKIVIETNTRLFCTRIALDGLSRFNDAFGHDGADEVLSKTIAHIYKNMPDAKNVRIFRTGSDWTLVFTGEQASELQRKALIWLNDRDNALVVDKGMQCTVSTLSFFTDIDPSKLKGAHSLINALRPGRATVQGSVAAVKGAKAFGVIDECNSQAIPFIDLSGTIPSYEGSPKEYVPRLVDRVVAENIDQRMDLGEQYQKYMRNSWRLFRNI